MKNYIRNFLLVLTLIIAYNLYDKFYIDNNNLEYVSSIVTKVKEVQKNVIKLKYQKTGPKAIAFAVDDDGLFVYWYTHDMISQKAANKIALRNCNKASKKLEVYEECKLYNELITDQYR